VDYLQATTKAQGNIRLYRYDKDTQPGVALAEKVSAAIDKADVVLVLLTRHSAHSQWVQQEIGIATKASKLIVTMRVNRSDFAGGSRA
jgi:3-hydroxyisobutyrate dehydrogenase-like beta-hydroxyacid dehydrogenase